MTNVRYLSQEYEYLVAAFVLRDTDFAARALPILDMAHDHFWGRKVIKEIVGHALRYFKRSHQLLGRAALRADFSRLTFEGTHPDTFLSTIDKLWELDLANAEYVLDTLAEAAKERLLLAADKDSLIATGQTDEFIALVKKIDDMTRTAKGSDDRIFHLTDDLDVISSPIEGGVPSPWDHLNRAMTAGGLTPGEVCIAAAGFNTGKSPFIGNWAVHAAHHLDMPTVFFAYETSRRNTQARLLRTLTGWSHEMMLDDPKGFKKLVEEQYAKIPLFIRYRPKGTHSVEQLEADVLRIEDKLQRKIELVARDYGELSFEAKSQGGDYRAVREAYVKFQAFLGRTGRVGLDCAQHNRQGQMSNFDILKDADVGVSLTQAQGRELLLVHIDRVREGSAGSEYHLSLDLSNGRMEEWHPPIPTLGELNEGGLAPNGLDPEVGRVQ